MTRSSRAYLVWVESPKDDFVASRRRSPPVIGSDGVPSEGEGGMNGTGEGAADDVGPVTLRAICEFAKSGVPSSPDVLAALGVVVMPQVVPPTDLVDGGPDPRVEPRGSDKGGKGLGARRLRMRAKTGREVAAHALEQGVGGTDARDPIVLLGLTPRDVELTGLGVEAGKHLDPGTPLSGFSDSLRSRNRGASGAASTSKAKVFGVVGSADVDAAAREGGGGAPGGAIVGHNDRLNGYVEAEVGAVAPDNGARFNDVVVDDILIFVGDDLREVVDILLGEPFRDLVGEVLEHFVQQASGEGGSLGAPGDYGLGGEDLGTDEASNNEVTGSAYDHQPYGEVPLRVVELEALVDEDVRVDAFVESIKVPEEGAAVEAVEGSDLELEGAGDGGAKGGRALAGGVPMAGHIGVPFPDRPQGSLGNGTVKGAEGGDGTGAAGLVADDVEEEGVPNLGGPGHGGGTVSGKGREA